MARNDLKSKEWQTEIDGLEALLRLVRFHPDIVEPDLHVIVADVTHECKNLRSQVTRAAIQERSFEFPDRYGQKRYALGFVTPLSSCPYLNTALL